MISQRLRASIPGIAYFTAALLLMSCSAQQHRKDSRGVEPVDYHNTSTEARDEKMGDGGGGLFGPKVKEASKDDRDGVDTDNTSATPSNPEERVARERAAIAQRLQSLGLDAQNTGGDDSTTSAPAVESGGGDAETCATTCELSEAICVSHASICEVAQEYPDIPEFNNDCIWAEDACQQAQDLCSACENP